MPRTTKVEPKDAHAYVPRLADAANEAVARLRFIHAIIDDDELIGDEAYSGYDNMMVTEAIARVIKLLEESLSARSTEPQQ